MDKHFLSYIFNQAPPGLDLLSLASSGFYPYMLRRTSSHAHLSLHSSFSERGEEPPTPTRTPTSATFLRTSFETPKQESSFYDSRVNWNTADPCSTSPDFLKTPKFQTFSTLKGSPSLAGLGRKRRFSGADIDDDGIASDVHHPSHSPNITLSPVGLSRPSSPNPSLSSSSTADSRHRALKPESIPLKTGSDEGIEPSMRSARSMQTPPPTSTSSSRRKTQQAQAAKHKQSDGNARCMSTPAIPNLKNAEALASHVEESPLHLGSFQFSPLAFDFPTSGASIAPTYPQNKLFWHPDLNKDAMNLDFADDDPFPVCVGQRGLDAFAADNKASHFHASRHFDNFSAKSSQTTDSRMLADLESAQQPDFLSTSGLMIGGKALTKYPGKGVNPSLLFGSPGRLAAQSTSAEVYSSDTLQPYAQQIREAQIENELSIARRSRKRRKPAVDSPAVKAALQALRDESDIDSDSHETAADRALDLIRKSRSQRNLVSFQSSKPSDHVRQGRSYRLATSAISRPRKKRPVVTLTIDAEGRAKTEAKPVPDDDAESSSKSIMDCASEDSETTSSSDSTVMLLSRPQSFCLPNQKHGKQQQARSSSHPNTHSRKPSYFSTLTLSNTANSFNVMEDPNRPRAMALGPSVDVQGRSYSINGLKRTSCSAKISGDRGNMRGIAGKFESETESVISSDDEKGDAQTELKKIIRDRARERVVVRSGLDNGQMGDARTYGSHRDRRQQNGYEGSLQPVNGRGSNAYENISPTTITDPGSSTPSSGYETTRCVCQLSEIDGELMILW